MRRRALSALCMLASARPTKGDGQSLLFGPIAVAMALLTMLMRSGVNLEHNVITLLVGALLGLTAYFWRAPLAFVAITAFVLVLSH
jgi:hypothetical protein